MEKINAVGHVFSTCLYTSGRVQHIGLLLLRDEKEGDVWMKKNSSVLLIVHNKLQSSTFSRSY